MKVSRMLQITIITMSTKCVNKPHNPFSKSGTNFVGTTAIKIVCERDFKNRQTFPRFYCLDHTREKGDEFLFKVFRLDFHI